MLNILGTLITYELNNNNLTHVFTDSAKWNSTSSSNEEHVYKIYAFNSKLQFLYLVYKFKDKELLIGDPDLNLSFCLENKYVSSPCQKSVPKIIILPLTFK